MLWHLRVRCRLLLFTFLSFVFDSVGSPCEKINIRRMTDRGGAYICFWGKQHLVWPYIIAETCLCFALRSFNVSEQVGDETANYRKSITVPE